MKLSGDIDVRAAEVECVRFDAVSVRVRDLRRILVRVVEKDRDADPHRGIVVRRRITLGGGDLSESRGARQKAGGQKTDQSPKHSSPPYRKEHSTARG
jgi:hypothetical protein